MASSSSSSSSRYDEFAEEKTGTFYYGSQKSKNLFKNVKTTFPPSGVSDLYLTATDLQAQQQKTLSETLSLAKIVQNLPGSNQSDLADLEERRRRFDELQRVRNAENAIDQLNQLKEEQTRLRKRIFKLESERNQLRQRLEEEARNQQSGTNDTISDPEEIRKFKKLIDSLNEKLSSTGLKSLEFERENSNLKAELDILKSGSDLNDTVRQENARLTTRIQALEKEISTEKQKVERNQTDLASLQRTYNENKNTYEQQLRKLTSEKNELAKQSENSQMELTEKSVEFENSKQELQRELAKVRSSLDACLKSKNSNEATEILAAETKRLSERNTNLQNELDSLQTNYETLRKSSSNNMTKITDSENLAKALQLKVNELEVRNKELEESQEDGKSTDTLLSRSDRAKLAYGEQECAAKFNKLKVNFFSTTGGQPFENIPADKQKECYQLILDYLGIKTFSSSSSNLPPISSGSSSSSSTSQPNKSQQPSVGQASSSSSSSSSQPTQSQQLGSGQTSSFDSNKEIQDKSPSIIPNLDRALIMNKLKDRWPMQYKTKESTLDYTEEMSGYLSKISETNSFTPINYMYSSETFSIKSNEMLNGILKDDGKRSHVGIGLTGDFFSDQGVGIVRLVKNLSTLTNFKNSCDDGLSFYFDNSYTSQLNLNTVPTPLQRLSTDKTKCLPTIILRPDAIPKVIKTFYSARTGATFFGVYFPVELRQNDVAEISNPSSTKKQLWNMTSVCYFFSSIMAQQIPDEGPEIPQIRYILMCATREIRKLKNDICLGLATIYKNYYTKNPKETNRLNKFILPPGIKATVPEPIAALPDSSNSFWDWFCVLSAVPNGHKTLSWLAQNDYRRPNEEEIAANDLELV